ncbi:hypothetical protein C8F04DRAFT_1399649, partial [Mycena alexandri]
MQRSLQGNQPILSVTSVPNSGGASSGTATVVFETAGQVLLAVIQQQSLTSGETPNQLAAGRQITVIAVNNAPIVPISSSTATIIVTPSTNSSPTTPTKTSVDAPQTTLTGLKNENQPTTSKSQSSTKAVSAAEPSNRLQSPFASAPIIGSAPIPTPSTSSVFSAPVKSSSPAAPVAHAVSGGPHAGVIAAVVLIPLLFLSLVVFCVVRRQRDSVRYRIDRFTAVWTQRRKASARDTISSFWNSNASEAKFIGSRAPPSEADIEVGMLPVVRAVMEQEQTLQLMVDQLTQRNATLEREMELFASASSPFSARPVHEPPPSDRSTKKLAPCNIPCTVEGGADTRNIYP